MPFCRKHMGNMIKRQHDYVCVVCDQRDFSGFTGLLMCYGCSVENKLCRNCGKELEFDVDDQQ